jgi:RNA polymerase sigma-70 factor (ECF subfamily)
MPFSPGERLFRKAEVLSRPQPLPPADADARRLSAGVARGEDAAFRELYDRYHQRVFRLSASLAGGDESLGREIVQSVMLAAAAKLKPVETEAHLWNWLALVARQKLGKARRQLQRDAVIISVPVLPEPAAPPVSSDILEEQLDAALRSLDEDDRRLLEWFYFDGLTQKQLAASLGASPKAISSRLERARAKLRESLNLSHES